MYEFETTDFAFSPKGIHLLRSSYNYKTIGYQEIDKATIKQASEIKNVLLSLILGIILFAFAILQTVYVIRLFNDPHVYHIYIETIVLPVLPGLDGLYLIYIAIKKGPVLIIEAGNKKHKLRLRSFVRSNKIIDVRNYLVNKLSHNLSIEDGI